MSILPTACRFPNCPEITKDSYCSNHKAYEKKIIAKYQANRPTDPFYTSSAWIKARNWYRKRHPLCEECLDEGQVVPMKIVDHIIDIKDGGAKFDQSNLRSLCHACHQVKTGERIKRERAKK